MTARARTAAVAAALVLGACGGDGGAVVRATTDRRFEPGRLVVDAGTEVTFENPADEPHTVTAYEGSLPDRAAYFASGGAASEKEARDDVAGGLLVAGQRMTVAFGVPGRYRYFCIPHEDQQMTGTIVVRP